jgi:hypothetical protein
MQAETERKLPMARDDRRAAAEIDQRRSHFAQRSMVTGPPAVRPEGA